MWGKNAQGFWDIEIEEDEVFKLQGRLNNEREHAWGHWQRKYINSLMESHRVNHGKQQIPDWRNHPCGGRAEEQMGVDEG